MEPATYQYVVKYAEHSVNEVFSKRNNITENLIFAPTTLGFLCYTLKHYHVVGLPHFPLSEWQFNFSIFKFSSALNHIMLTF